jgi:predicted PurR-regulated permease PerM
VGDSLGIHPLATLASIYVGIKLIGLGGIFVGPIIALSLKSFMKSES